MKNLDIRTLDAIADARTKSGRPYLEFLRVPAMSAGLYVLPAGGDDRQRPHAEDEIYYVVEGKARFRADGEVEDVGPGSVIYVRRTVPHRFEAIERDLTILVVFAPCETGPAGESA